jgi:hypothetical protein
MRTGLSPGVCVAALCLVSFASAQEKEKEPPKVDQARIDAAIEKGAEWLRSRVRAGIPALEEEKDGNHSGQTYKELILYALLHAGVDRTDPEIIKLLQDSRKDQLRHTYTSAIRAMAYETYDPEKLRYDIAQCADFLVNNQDKDGQWGYSRRISLPPVPHVTFTPSKTPVPPKYYTVSKPGASGEDAKIPVPGTGDAPPAAAGQPRTVPPAGAAASPPPGAGTPAPGGKETPAGATPASVGSNMTQVKGAGKKEPPKIVISRREFGSGHDNSNTQYALLGLSACIAVPIFPAPDVLPLAEKWWTDCQNDDGGWGYTKGSKSIGRMTAGGVSSLAVCLRGDGQGRDPMQDDRIKKGIEWLAANMTFSGNPKGPNAYWSHYYWIYAVERAGSLAGTEWFGTRPWYSEGAEFLLTTQNADGTWGKAENDGALIIDTCWSILFLRRATKQIQKRLKEVVYTK